MPKKESLKKVKKSTDFMWDYKLLLQLLPPQILIVNLLLSLKPGIRIRVCYERLDCNKIRCSRIFFECRNSELLQVQKIE